MLRFNRSGVMSGEEVKADGVMCLFIGVCLTS